MEALLPGAEIIAVLAALAAVILTVRERIELLSARCLSLAMIVLTVLVPALFFMEPDAELDQGVLAEVRLLHCIGVIVFAFAYLVSYRSGSSRTYAPFVYDEAAAPARTAYVTLLLAYVVAFLCLADSPLLLSLFGDFEGAIRARLAITHGYSSDAFPTIFRYWGLVFYYLAAPALLVVSTHAFRMRRHLTFAGSMLALFWILSASMEKANIIKFFLCLLFVPSFALGRAIRPRVLVIAGLAVTATSIALQYLLVNFGESSVLSAALAAFERVTVYQTKSSQYAYQLLQHGLPSGFSFIDYSFLNDLIGVDPEQFRQFKLDVFMLTTRQFGDEVVGSAGGFGLVHLYLQFGLLAFALFLAATVVFLLIDDALRRRCHSPEARALYLWFVLMFFLIPVTGFEYFFSIPFLLSPPVWVLLFHFWFFFSSPELSPRDLPDASSQSHPRRPLDAHAADSA